MPEATTTAPAAGWYPDPAGGDGQRWWDGARWTENTIARPASALVVPPPPPEESAASGQPAARPELAQPQGVQEQALQEQPVQQQTVPQQAEQPAATPQREPQRDLAWVADAAAAGASSEGLTVPEPPARRAGEAAGTATGDAAPRDAIAAARAVNVSPIQTTGPQPSFGGYVAIRPARTGLVTGAVMLLVVLALAGVVAAVVLGAFVVPWPLPIHEEAWMWGALLVAVQFAAAIVALVVAVRGRASTVLGIIAVVVAVLTAGGVVYLQWGAALLS